MSFSAFHKLTMEGLHRPHSIVLSESDIFDLTIIQSFLMISEETPAIVYFSFCFELHLDVEAEPTVFCTSLSAT